MSLSSGWALGGAALVLGATAAAALVLSSGGRHPPAQATPAVATTETTAARLPPRTISVEEYEFGFKLSRDTISAGRVTFVMTNVGSLMHDFDLVGVMPGTYLEPDQTLVAHANLKPGTYTYVCDVYGHAAEGMEGTLVVTRR
jgi:plastocyanin